MVGEAQEYSSVIKVLSSLYKVKPDDEGKELDCILNVLIDSTSVEVHKRRIEVVKLGKLFSVNSFKI